MKSNKTYSHVIWDWNGTLLDDVCRCIEVVNYMLAKRSLKPLAGIEEYHDAFCFPVINYYKNVGFDLEKEPFEELAKEFISLYHSPKGGSCKLHRNAEEVLKTLQNLQVTQAVLSASEKYNLITQIGEFNIAGYFDETLGLSDIYAKSKVAIGQDYLARKRAASVLLIGDTLHDFEVAAALGADCLLIASGHQSKAVLLHCGVPVLDDILQVLEYFRSPV